MLNVTVNNRFGLHQRIMLMIMLVLLQFYSIGSDFFPEDIITTSMEMVDQEAPDVLLDFDDNASLRTVRQEQVQIRALEIDLIWDLFTILDLHELIHSLELRQCAKLPLFYNLHREERSYAGDAVNHDHDRGAAVVCSGCTSRTVCRGET